MKRTKLKQIGKIGKINQKANREIAKLWLKEGIALIREEVFLVLRGEENFEN